MEISKEERPNITIVVIKGKLDANNVDKFSEFTRKLAPYSKHIGINMEHVEFMDSTGIGALVNLFTKLRHVGKNLYLFGVNNTVKEVLKAADVSNFLNVMSKAEFNLTFPDEITDGIKRLI